jgi:carboxyl-terminal processing protease
MEGASVAGGACRVERKDRRAGDSEFACESLAIPGKSANLTIRFHNPMNVLRFLIVPVVASLALSPFAQGGNDTDFKKIAPKVAQTVGELLEKAHYSRRRLDDSVSKQFLKNYLERLDYNHLFFTQRDVDGFSAKYATTLDDSIMAGDLDPSVKMFDVYRKRVEDRVAKVKALLGEKFDFSTTRMVELNRQKSPWPKDEAEADQIWKDRIEGELLDRTLMNDKVETPVKVVSRRYDQLLRSLHEQTNEDVMAGFLSVLCETYDPHSEYMSRSQLDNFNINISLQLIGIGAVLVSEEGYAKIRELVPGGPADLSGRLKVGDRISAVAQGNSGFVETADMKLDKVVEMIRGKEDTNVVLRIIPANATDPSARKVVEITRKKVTLKEQEAKAEIVERKKADGTPVRIGWIILPSFYADMQKTGTKSTTKDILVLLERLKKENIQGLVMDLRRDGGGSLEEAVNLTGLFIKSGPVVMARDSNNRNSVLRDRDKTLYYDGPMLVVTNKLSASASEIFAAALQDYNRAVIVGDSTTFGKGTVQTMVELGNIIPLSLSSKSTGNEAGALKLTIQKFYRISGGSTQLQGVQSDIKLPSLWDQADIGEVALKGPMPYDTIEPVAYDKWELPLHKAELKQRSTARVAADEEFQWILEDMARMKDRVAENKISLNEKVRRAELDGDKARKEKRNADRAKLKPVEEKVYVVTLDNAAAPELELKKEKKIVKEAAKKGDEAKPADAEDEDGELAADEAASKVDPIRNESINILNDLIDLSRNPPPATASAEKTTAATK